MLFPSECSRSSQLMPPTTDAVVMRRAPWMPVAHPVSSRCSARTVLRSVAAPRRCRLWPERRKHRTRCLQRLTQSRTLTLKICPYRGYVVIAAKLHPAHWCFRGNSRADPSANHIQYHGGLSLSRGSRTKCPLSPQSSRHALFC